MQDRGYLLWKFADLIEREAHDLAIVETLVSNPPLVAPSCGAPGSLRCLITQLMAS